MPDYLVLLCLEGDDRVLETTVDAPDAASAAIIASDRLGETTHWPVRQILSRRVETS